MHDLFAGLTAPLPLLDIDWWRDVGHPTVTTIVLGTFCVVLMLVALWLLDKITPSFSLHVELQEKQNVALAIVAAAIVIGIALVVASAARG